MSEKEILFEMTKDDLLALIAEALSPDEVEETPEDRWREFLK